MSNVLGSRIVQDCLGVPSDGGGAGLHEGGVHLHPGLALPTGRHRPELGPAG